MAHWLRTFSIGLLILGTWIFMERPLLAGPIQTGQPTQNSAEAAFADGAGALARGDLKEAEAAFWKSLRLDKSLVEAYVGLADVALKKGDPNGAEQQLRNAFREAPKSLTVALARGYFFTSQKRFAEARTAFEQAAQLDAQPETPLMSLSNHDVGASEAAQEALEKYRKELAANPTNAGVHYALGVALADTEHSGKAIAELTKAGCLVSDDSGTADLWLINPAAVLFGPNVQFNVSGSFDASADHLRMSDGARFTPDPTMGSVLSIAPVGTFGFLGDPSSLPTMTVDGSTRTVNTGRTLSLIGVVGESIQATGGLLRATGGRLRLANVSGEAVVPEQATERSSTSFLHEGSSTGNNHPGANHTTNGAGAVGTLVIRGGQVNLSPATTPLHEGGTASGTTTGGNLIIKALNGSFVLVGQAPSGVPSTVLVPNDGVGAGGNPGMLMVDAHQVILQDRAHRQSGNGANGHGENLKIIAGDSLMMSGQSLLSSLAVANNVGLIDVVAKAGSVILNLDGRKYRFSHCRQHG
jgi:Tfp pilus assembly protein PilF